MFSDKELILIADDKNADLKVSGAGEKGIFLFVAYENEMESLISFLSKILEALKIDLEKDTCLTILKPNDNFSFFQNHQEAKHLFLFGVNPSQIGLNINLGNYKLIHLNKLKVLKSDALSSIQKDEKLKRILWNCLKEWER